jgi:hypothetical protein
MCDCHVKILVKELGSGYLRDDKGRLNMHGKVSGRRIYLSRGLEVQVLAVCSGMYAE